MKDVKPRFSLGATVATPAALQLCEEANVAPSELLARHVAGDWGELENVDKKANEEALVWGERVLSAYTLPTGERLYVITEADRSSTCVLRVSEY